MDRLCQFPFGAAKRGNQQQFGSAAVQPTKKRDGASVRRPGRAKVFSGICGQSQSTVGTDLPEVNIKVILFVAIPGEGDLLAVGRERRVDFETRFGGKGARTANGRRWILAPVAAPEKPTDHQQSNQ